LSSDVMIECWMSVEEYHRVITTFETNIMHSSWTTHLILFWRSPHDWVGMDLTFMFLFACWLRFFLGPSAKHFRKIALLEYAERERHRPTKQIKARGCHDRGTSVARRVRTISSDSRDHAPCWWHITSLHTDTYGKAVSDSY
jgi:hypothetical protein